MKTVGIGVRGRVVQILGNAILLIGVFLTIMPFFYMVSASFKPGSELYSIPVQVLPRESVSWGTMSCSSMRPVLCGGSPTACSSPWRGPSSRLRSR